MLLTVGSGLTAHCSSQFIERKIEGSHGVNSLQYSHFLKAIPELFASAQTSPWKQVSPDCSLCGVRVRWNHLSKGHCMNWEPGTSQKEKTGLPKSCITRGLYKIFFPDIRLFIPTWMALYKWLNQVPFKPMERLPWTSAVMELHPKLIVPKRLICKICSVQAGSVLWLLKWQLAPHLTAHF